MILVFGSLYSYAQHTFSIVAIDPVNGQIGSAGATCLTSGDCGGCGGAVIISGIIPGKGAVNAQATVCIPNVNSDFVKGQLRNGKSATEALTQVLANDQCQFGTSADRQYGIVSYQNGVIDAQGYTGDGALSYAGHRVGANYSIQGNILLGPEIVDSMEARFIRSEGLPLALRLMEAMQGANVVGADSRCAEDGLSSKSSFLRIANNTDPEGTFAVNFVVGSTAAGVDPIDSLQSLVSTLDPVLHILNTQQDIGLAVYPNPSKDLLFVEVSAYHNGMHYALIDCLGRQCLGDAILQNSTTQIEVDTLENGIYFLNIYVNAKLLRAEKIQIQR